MRKPDFFIVGAPKCGTSSLHAYLDVHPQIYTARGEPHFFGTDIAFHGARRLSLDDYLNHFADAGDATLLGEKSVYYLYSRRAAKEIQAFNPQARIIIMLRNPADMLYSLHAQYLLRAGFEDIPDFEAALDAEADRKQGRRVPAKARFREALYYSELPRYTQQIRRYLDCFSRDQIHIILFDDLAQDPHSTYRRLLAFLDVEQDFELQFSVHNKALAVRSPFLYGALNRIDQNHSLRERVRSVLPPQIISQLRSLRQALSDWNNRSRRRRPLPPHVRRRLSDLFREEVEELGELLGKDLSHWTSEASR